MTTRFRRILSALAAVTILVTGFASARPAHAISNMALCQQVIRTTATLARPAGTSVTCVAKLGAGQVGSSSLTGGRYAIRILASSNVAVMRHAIAHESAHVYEYARPAVAGHVSEYLGKPFFGNYPYNSKPEEIWAESVAVCQTGRLRGVNIAPLIPCQRVTQITWWS